jgi:hypothetical protein
MGTLYRMLTLELLAIIHIVLYVKLCVPCLISCVGV